MNLHPRHKDVLQVELRKKIIKEIQQKAKKDDEELTLEEFIYEHGNIDQ